MNGVETGEVPAGHEPRVIGAATETLSVAVGLISVPPAGLPVAVAVFVISVPALKSAAVTT